MYRIDISSLEQFKLFLDINDSDYVDGIINNRQAIFVSNTKEKFAALQLDTVAVDETESLQIRFPRKLLRNLATNGHMLVNIDNENLVNVQFFEVSPNGDLEKTCSARFIKQNIWTEGYRDKLELLQNMDMSVKHDIKPLLPLIKIGRALNCNIDCNYGVACASLSSNCRVFTRLSSSMDFSLTASEVATLVKISTTVFEYKNYVGVNMDGLTMLCTKVHSNTNEDLDLVDKERASFRCKMDIRFLNRFISKMKIEQNAILVNFTNSEASIESGTKAYKIPIMVRDLEKSPALDECKAYIPKGALDIMGKIFDNIVHVYNKRNFLQVVGNDMTLIFRS